MLCRGSLALLHGDASQVLMTVTPAASKGPLSREATAKPIFVRPHDEGLPLPNGYTELPGKVVALTNLYPAQLAYSFDTGALKALEP